MKNRFLIPFVVCFTGFSPAWSEEEAQPGTLTLPSAPTTDPILTESTPLNAELPPAPPSSVAPVAPAIPAPDIPAQTTPLTLSGSSEPVAAVASPRPTDGTEGERWRAHPLPYRPLPLTALQNKFFEVSWSMMVGPSEFEVENTIYPITTLGGQFELFLGTAIPSHELFRFGLAPTFQFLIGTEEFEHIGGDNRLYNADFFSFYAAFGLKLKYSLGGQFGPVTVAFQQGIGFAYGFYGYDVKYTDQNNSDNTHDESIDDGGAMPALDLGLKLKYQVTDYSYFGIGGGIELLAAGVGDLSQPFAVRFGITYQLIY